MIAPTMTATIVQCLPSVTANDLQKDSMKTSVGHPPRWSRSAPASADEATSSDDRGDLALRYAPSARVADPAASGRRPELTTEARTGVKQAEREHIDAPRRPRAPDRGTTFVELLVSIVLIGTAVVATLVAVRAVTFASRAHLDQAWADAWLFEAADRVQQAPRVPCDGSNTDDIIDAYEAAADDAPPPVAWASGSIAVIDVEFVQRADQNAPYTFGDACFETLAFADAPHRSQRVTLQVTLPDGGTRVTDTVKHG